MTLRLKKRLIAFGYHSIILAIAVIGANTEIFCFVYIGIFDLLTFRLIPITRLIQSKLITTAHCHSCKKPIDLVDYWKCGCGYASQVPKHIFKSCSQCGKIFTFINCPHCDIGILV